MVSGAGEGRGSGNNLRAKQTARFGDHGLDMMRSLPSRHPRGRRRFPACENLPAFYILC
jgi:hypothetical protein